MGENGLINLSVDGNNPKEPPEKIDIDTDFKLEKPDIVIEGKKYNPNDIELKNRIEE